METLSQDIVQETLLDSVVECVRGGDISIAIGAVRGELDVLELGLDSLTFNELAGSFQELLHQRTGRRMNGEEADEFVGILTDMQLDGGTLAQAASAVYRLLCPAQQSEARQ